MIHKLIALVFISLYISLTLFAQTTHRPNYGEKSHPTLDILRIEITTNQTIISFSLENKSSEGDWFCADKNIYLKNSIGTEKYTLTRAENIPTCPENYHFTKVGEILFFTLYFPKISPTIQYIDIVEDCSNACFSFKGVILGEDVNRKIDDAVKMYNTNLLLGAARYFEDALLQLKNYNYGALYYNLIRIYAKQNQLTARDAWLVKLKNSNCVDKNKLIAKLKSEGISVQ